MVVFGGSIIVRDSHNSKSSQKVTKHLAEHVVLNVIEAE